MDHLRYALLNNFDRAMQHAEDKHKWMIADHVRPPPRRVKGIERVSWCSGRRSLTGGG